MKTSDFMPYTGTSKMPYSFRILGIIRQGDDIPDDDYAQGDCYLVTPEDGCGMVIVFFDGTQFRYPKGKAMACAGRSRNSDEIEYCLESSFFEMFNREDDERS